MSNSIRHMIYKKVVPCLHSNDQSNIHNAISNITFHHNKNGNYSFLLPLKSSQYNIENEITNIENNKADDILNDTTLQSEGLAFHVSRDKCIKEILESNYDRVSAPKFIDTDKTVIVEFSSPNIAKPFHVGHLRSTIIGNYVANINAFLGNKVKRINYLGDWGTQFGLLQVGLTLACIDDEQMKNNPIKSLYAAYVSANKLAEDDPWIMEKARNIFKQLEVGDEILSEQWLSFRHYTVEELKRTYNRLGVSFDEYHWESMYNAKNIGEILLLMRRMHLLVKDKENREVIYVQPEKAVPIVKSDGTTLYITRDIAAAYDRYEKTNFDSMYYVVDKSQSNHFTNLIAILKKMEMSWADRLKHVQYGRVRGMSTRKGTAIFLEDILDETRDIMKERQRQSHTTKVPLDVDDSVADILGISSLIVNDLRQRKQSDYSFNWNAIFDAKGETGVRLQYTHCRLVNLELTCGATLSAHCEPSVLHEPEVDHLIIQLGKFEEAVLKSYMELEPCILTKYLLHLCSATNKAMKVLRIKGECSDVGNQRLLLFHTVKNVLAQGMKVIGLKPLNQM